MEITLQTETERAVTCAYCDRALNPDTAWYGPLNRFECGFACPDCKPVRTIIDTDYPEEF